MFDEVFAPHNLPFATALGLMIVIGVVEAVSTVFGVGVSHWIDAHWATPDLASIPGGGPDGATAGGTPGGAGIGGDASSGVFTAVLGWFRVGQAPFLILLVVVCFVFGLSGLAIQALAQAALGGPLPVWAASAVAAAVSAPLVSFAARGIARVLPADETEAVSRESFVGRSAQLLSASAAVGAPAQAKLYDDHGRAHYILVEPDGGGPFAPGQEVIVTELRGAVFLAVPGAPPPLKA